MDESAPSTRPTPRTAAALEAELRRRLRITISTAREAADGELSDEALAAAVANAIVATMQWHLDAPEHARGIDRVGGSSWRGATGPRGRPPAERQWDAEDEEEGEEGFAPRPEHRRPPPPGPRGPGRPNWRPGPPPSDWRPRPPRPDWQRRPPGPGFRDEEEGYEGGPPRGPRSSGPRGGGPGFGRGGPRFGGPRSGPKGGGGGRRPPSGGGFGPRKPRRPS